MSNTDKASPTTPSVPPLHNSSSHGYSSLVAGKKTTFVRRVDLLKGRLHRFKRFSWRFLIMLFSYIDISLAVAAVILGSLTINYCDGSPDTAKILAIINTVISAMIALFKGTGLPTSLIAIDQRAEILRYRLADIEAGCQQWATESGLVDERKESPVEHEEHKKAFESIQAEYNQLSNDVGDMMGQIFTGSGIKSNKANQDDSKKTDKSKSAEAPNADQPNVEEPTPAAAKD
ncbi:hypothetical protein EHS25_002262 [Saitozyma podzolica]|uniref:SMODS and SLOG-associating 2TM effector domain-containing protein n=1 Tax=Saitozyma podzolica TaxID=1890683 RepID=A0A427YEW7_9TREE|nr:hypothetical protein EHS25_002262 [Saitozyma podzolica]